MSTKSRLLEKTGDLQPPPMHFDVEPAPASVAVTEPPNLPTRPANASSVPVAPAIQPLVPGSSRTAPGRMAEFRRQLLGEESEASKLREKLKEYEGAAATKLLDPQTIVASQWANRHPDAFKTADFERLKQDIRLAGGNVQPIAVRPLADQPGRYEIVFGHRRHRACLELGIQVLATIVSDPLTDLELFVAMDRENRERADLSPFEQGQMYRKALDAGLYPSNRRLAEALGVSHTWVANVLTVADLPQSVVECFRSPIEIQHRHAKAIAAALEQDRKGVLRRAEKVRQAEKKPSAGEVVSALCKAADNTPPVRLPITVGGKAIGTWTRDTKGRVQVQLETPGASDAQVQAALENLAAALA